MHRLYDQPFPDGEYRYMQTSYVVLDVVAAAWAWVDLHGAGPFVVMAPVDFEAPFRGGSARLNYRIAVTQMGPMQIELIEVLDDSPNYFRDMYAPGHAGAHHLSSVTDDFDGLLDHYTAAGFEPVSVFPSSAGRVAYIDTRPATGLFTEVLEKTDVMLNGLRRTAALCAQWDGIDPVRVFGEGRGYTVPPRPNGHLAAGGA